MVVLPGAGDWRRRHLANMHRNTPQSMLFSCCGMSFGAFVKKHQCFTSRLLSTCCSSFHILAVAFSADGFVKDPALLSKTRTRFSLGRTTRRNQCLLRPGLHGTRTASSVALSEELFLSRDLSLVCCQILSQMPPSPEFLCSDL